MRVRLDGYARAYASLRRRAMVLVVAGVILLLVWMFFAFAVIVAAASTAKEIEATPEARWIVIVGLSVVCFFAFVPGTLLLWRGLVNRSRLRRIRELSVLARQHGVTSSADVARSLQLAPAAAESLMRDAADLGVFELPPADPLGATLPASAAGMVDGYVGLVLNATYRLEEHLGAGAMGTVYAARHLRTGRFYAVKLIRPDARSGNDLVRRFQREATAAGGLGHPNIVGVHDVDVTPEGIHYLVMDLLRGETLERRMERTGALPFEEARRVALDVGDALSAAHGAGLLHRDVKPANVFLTYEGARVRAVLLDFGLVKRLDDAGASRLTRSGATVGTPLYMSPEQARGEQLDVRSDVYGLAAVLYEMITGAPPFADRTIAAVYARLLNEPPPRPSTRCAVPPGVDDLLDRGLAKQRESRFPDVKTLANQLARIAP